MEVDLPFQPTPETVFYHDGLWDQDEHEDPDVLGRKAREVAYNLAGENVFDVDLGDKVITGVENVEPVVKKYRLAGWSINVHAPTVDDIEAARAKKRTRRSRAVAKGSKDRIVNVTILKNTATSMSPFERTGRSRKHN